jgi:hypothetical protein
VVELGEHRCYAKVSARGARLPVFSVELDPPPAGDSALADQLADQSAARYGRDAAQVEADLDAALERVRLHRRTEDRSRGSREHHGGGCSGWPEDLGRRVPELDRDDLREAIVGDRGPS